MIFIAQGEQAAWLQTDDRQARPRQRLKFIEGCRGRPARGG
jgi:hypothetical protein